MCHEEAAGGESAGGAANVVSTSRPARPTFSSGRGVTSHLACEFRRDSIRRCFCCWRLVRPPGDPAAEEEALLVRGKSQLILHGAPGPRPWTVPACFSHLLSPAVVQRRRSGTDARDPGAGRPRLLYASPAGGPRGPGGMPRTVRLRAAGERELAARDRPHSLHVPDAKAASQRASAPSLCHPRLPPLRAPPPLRVASSPRAPAGTHEKRRRSAVRRRSGSPSPSLGERCLWGIRCRRRYRHRRRRRVLSLWREGGGEARAQ